MTDLQKIAKQLKLNCVKHRKIPLFSGCDATILIYELERLQVRILGVDAFILKNESIQPIMECGIDFCLTGTSHQGCWSDAIKLIEKNSNPDLFYEIVI